MPPTDRRAHLAQLLHALKPHDEREAAYRARMLELAAVPGDPFSRKHFEPGHFTASSFVRSPDGKSLLLILHAKLHKWLQPGGHVDPEDDDIVEAARREVLEEVGLAEADLALAGTGVFDADIHPIPPLKGEPAHEHFDVRFLFDARTVAFKAGAEVNGAKWVLLGEIDGIQSDESVLRAVRKLTQTGTL